MNYKKFIQYFLLSFLLIYACIIGINYYFDFYGVFRQDKEVYYESINDRYAKISYVLKNKDKYDTFIWGSSRVQKANSSIISKKSYNMGASAGSPEDCLRDLKILINNEVKIKKLYLGIDNFSYKNCHEYDIISFNRIPYGDNVSNFKYLSRVILKEPDFHKIKASIGVTDYRVEKNFLTSTGKLEVPEYIENQIEASINEYVQDKKFQNSSHADDKNEHIDSTISIIKEIKQICDANNINLVVFFNPVHITSYLKDDIHISNRFKKELANITDFYDFNYVNFITVNNYFWYETSHPRYFVCDWQLKVITNQYDEKIPKDFGHLVTKKNVDYYCNKYKIDKENFKMPEKQYIPEYPII